jgi:mannonate dehydratase
VHQPEDRKGNHSPAVDRRDFAKLALGGAAALASARSASAVVVPNAPGIKVGISGGQGSEDNWAFLKQIGVEYVSLGATPETATAEGFKKIKSDWEGAGFKVYNIGSGMGPSGSLHNMPEVTLNLPGRDQKIAEYKNYLRYLGEAGIHYTAYAHMGNGIWSSGRGVIRGNDGRELDLSSPNRQGVWAGKTYKEPLSHGRVYTEKEIWDNFTYFIKQVVPVAEEAGVRIGIHPDDPPQPVLAGVPRCIFGNFAGYVRALDIANSDNVGVCLCVGCWLEGGPLMGKDAADAIRYFGSHGKLFKVHFRNVSAPLPHFIETFMDNGYYEMSKIMKAMVDVKFDGIAIPDHIPQLAVGAAAAGGAGDAMRVASNRAGQAYSIAYMRALMKAAMEEKA